MNTSTPSLTELVRSMADENSALVIYRNNQGVIRKTYAQCYQDAKALACALIKFGIKQGDLVAIHGRTSYSWFISDLACILVGAISLALYPSVQKSRILNALKEMKASILLTEDYDSFSVYSRAGCQVIWLNDQKNTEVDSVGSLINQFSSTPFIPQPSFDGPFTIVSTSGTLSEPKFFAVQAQPLLYTMARFDEIYELSSQDSLLMVLPQSHLPQRMIAYGMLKNRSTIILSHPTRLVQDSREFSPTIHVVVPRILQYFDTQLSQLSASSQKIVDTEQDLGAKVWGNKARYVFVGSAPTPKPVLEKLRSLGCPIFEIYGTTELGIISMNTPQHYRLGTVGKVVSWGELRIESQSGEVLFSTKIPFFYGSIESEKITHQPNYGQDFISTGDVGSLDDDGYLTLKGRTQEFIALLSGEKIFARPLEESIAKITGVELAIIICNGDRYISVIIFLDNQSGLESLESRKEFFKSQIKLLNSHLHPWERIKQFLLVDEIPSVENGCLTETLKIRRHIIGQRYNPKYQSYISV